MKLLLPLIALTLGLFRFLYIRHYHKLQSPRATHDSIYGGL
jgi:hypothetical protein